MNEIEYFIFIPVKNFIAGAAKVARYLMWLALLTALAEPVVLLTMGPMACEIFGKASDQLLYGTLILISVLSCWGQHVLLSMRGSGITRFLTLFAVIMSVILLVCTVYTLFTQELLLIRQHQTPAIIATILFLSSLLNLPYMAAAPRKLRILVPAFLFFLLACVVTTVVPPLCLICKIITTCMGIPLLRRLQHVAPLIISMPPRK